jgi:hypothetical protein
MVEGPATSQLDRRPRVRGVLLGVVVMAGALIVGVALLFLRPRRGGDGQPPGDARRRGRWVFRRERHNPGASDAPRREGTLVGLITTLPVAVAGPLPPTW